jgi:3-hydroxyisobutyrate dehydrogenase-like beta-hydroxyacid dehydrogenase
VRAGFIGLGIMGRGMAGNLLKKGIGLAVCNRTAERAAPFAERGAVVCASPAAVAADCDIVGICVTDGAAVEEVVRGLRPALRPGQYVVDHSTISPEQARRLAADVARTGAEMLDAPVTGGDRGAAAGTLTIMVGGSAEAFSAVRPYLEAVGKKIVHVGGSGQGQLVKLVNNFIGGIAMAGAAEGLLLGLRGGVPLATMMEVLSAGSAASVSLQLLADRLARGDFAPGFSLANRLKDMELALETARGLAADTPVGAVATDIFRGRRAEGEGDLDQTVLMRHYLGRIEGPVG